MVRKDTAVHCVGAESKICIPRKAFSQSEYRTHALIFVGDSIIRKKTFWRYRSFSWDTRQKWNCQWEKLFKQASGLDLTLTAASWAWACQRHGRQTLSPLETCLRGLKAGDVNLTFWAVLSMCDASNVSSVSDVTFTNSGLGRIGHEFWNLLVLEFCFLSVIECH